MPSSPRDKPSHSSLGQGTKTRPTAAAALGSTWGLYPAMHLCDPNRSRRPRLARWGGGDAIARDESTGTLLIPRLRRPRMSPQDRRSFLKTTTLSAAALALPHLIEPSHARGAGGPGFVTTNDGYKLRYEEAGSGKPLVCIPGWSQTAAQFKHQLTGLNDRYRVIAVDMRGHGEPDKPAHGYSIARLSKDVHDLLADLSLADVRSEERRVGKEPRRGGRTRPTHT